MKPATLANSVFAVRYASPKLPAATSIFTRKTLEIES